MGKENQHILFILFLLTIVFSYGQKLNSITIDPSLPVFGTIQLQYERGITKNMSLSVSFGYKRSSGIFEIQGIDTDNIITNDFNFEGFKIIPEFRWYLQKKALSGLYLGAYYKHQDYKFPIEGTYYDNAQNSYEIDLEGTVLSNAVGIQIGYKLMIKNRFVIDFLIAGPGLSFNTFELVENKPIPEGFYDDLSEAISQYGIFENLNTEFEIDANQKTDKILLPAFRYGIKFGYAF